MVGLGRRCPRGGGRVGAVEALAAEVATVARVCRCVAFPSFRVGEVRLVWFVGVGVKIGRRALMADAKDGDAGGACAGADFVGVGDLVGAFALCPVSGILGVGGVEALDGVLVGGVG